MLLPKDYIRYRLTGEYAMDKADGAGTVLFDLTQRDWSEEVLAALEVPPAWMPKTFEGPECTGFVTEAAASLTGLRAGTPVVAGGGDQAAQAVGVGAVEPGIVGLTVGTSGVVFATTPSALIEPGRPPACLLPRRAGHVAFHGRDALGRGQPAVVSRYAWLPR